MWSILYEERSGISEADVTLLKIWGHIYTFHSEYYERQFGAEYGCGRGEVGGEEEQQ